MILGCGCHCVEESSESHSDSTPSDSDPSDNPPSESRSDDPPSDDPPSDGPPSDNPPDDSEPSDSESSFDITSSTCSSGTCIGNVFATRYRMTYNFGNSDWCGPAYQGSFILEFSGGTSTHDEKGGCGWKTVELPKAVDFRFPEFVTQCYEGTRVSGIERARFSLQMYQKNAINAYTKDYRISVLAVTDGNNNYNVDGQLMNVIGYAGNFTLPSSKINCLGSMTLPIFPDYTANQLTKFAKNISYTAVAGDIPTSVTIVPA